MKKRIRLVKRCLAFLLTFAMLGSSVTVLAEEAEPAAGAGGGNAGARESTRKLEDIVTVDGEGKKELTVTYTQNPEHEGGAIEPTDALKFDIHYTISSANKPETKEDYITYALPNGIDYPTDGDVYINGQSVGEYTIGADNVLKFSFDDNFLNGITGEISGDFSFESKLDLDKIPGPKDNITFDFPGAQTFGPFDIIEPSTVESITKSIESKGETSDLYTKTENGKLDYYADFKIEVVVNGDQTVDAVVTDTLGSNFEFVEDSFKLDNNQFDSVSFAGNVATINLGTRGAGTYAITYTAKLLTPTLNSHDPAEDKNNTNGAAVTWGDEESKTADPVTVNYPANTAISKTGEVTTKDEKQYGDFKWTIVVNDPAGTRRDVSGFTVIDNLSRRPSQNPSGPLRVVRVDENGVETVVEDNVDISTFRHADGYGFDYTLPLDAGTDTFKLYFYSVFVSSNATQSVSEGDEFTNSTILHNADGGVVERASDTVPYSKPNLGLKIKKECISVSEDGKTTTWRTVIDTSGLGMRTATDLTYTDTISADSDKSFYVEMVNVSQGEKVYEEWDGFYEDEPMLPDYTNEFSLFFPSVAAADGDITIEYKLTPEDPDFVGEITNTGTVSSDNLGINESDEATDNIIVTSVRKSHEADATAYDTDKAGYVTPWTIEIGPEDLKTEPYDFGGEPLVLTDDWKNEHMELDDISITAYSWVDKKVVESPLDASEYTIEKKKDGGVDITILNPGQRSFKINYTTIVPDSKILGTGDKAETFENTVNVQQDGKDVYDNPVTDEETINYTEKVLTKEGEGVGADTGGVEKINISYAIRVNPKAANLDTESNILTLRDKIVSTDKKTGARNGKILPDTLKVFYGLDGDKKGNELKKYDEYQVYFDAATGQMTLEIPDEKFLIVEYEVYPLGERKNPAETSVVDNEVSLEGSATYTVDDSTETLLKAGSATVTGDNNSLIVHKMDEHGRELGGATFTLYAVEFLDGGGALPRIVGEGVTTDNTGTVIFKDLVPNTAYIIEESESPENYVAKATQYLVILKSTNADREDEYQKVLAQATEVYPDIIHNNQNITVYMGDSYDITNVPGVTVEPEVTKVIEGNPDNKNATFHFKIKALGGESSDGTPIAVSDVPMPGITTTSITGEGTKSFGAIDYDAVGTYDYQVTETAGRVQNYTYDSSVYTMRVTITKDGDAFRSQVTYDKDGEPADNLTFTNTYVTPDAVTFAPSVRKVLNGTPDDPETFEFEIAANADTPDAPMPDSNNKATVQGAGTASFHAISFDKPGTYKYDIKEIDKETPNFTYDKTVYTMTVKVTEENAHYRTAVTYAVGDTEAGEMKFTNTYTRPDETVAVPEVTKVVNGNPDQDETFRFQIEAVTPNAPMPAHTQTSVVGAGTATFDGISYQSAGMYDYTISEIQGKGINYTYDTTQYTMRVVITETEGKYNSEIIYKKDGAVVDKAEFTNTYTRPGAAEVTPAVQKVVNGNPDTPETFAFTIKAITKNAPMPESNKTTVQGAGTAQFGKITYDKPGTFVYEVSETHGITYEYTYDKTVYRMTVKVSEVAGAETYATEVSYTAADEPAASMVFKNTYTRPDEVQVVPEVTKDVEGNPVKDETFTFQITAAEGTPMPAQTQTSVVGSGTADFGAITYNAAGTYDYTVSEVKGSAVNYAYDETLYNMHVVVTANRGKYQAAVTYTDGTGAAATQMTFTNTYNTPARATFTPEVTKDVKGSPQQDATFTFHIKATDGTDFEGKPIAVSKVPMPAGETTAEVTGSGTRSFGMITYDAAGTYDYEITEEEGKFEFASDYSFDKSIYKMQVVVTEVQGGYAYEVTYEKGDAAAESMTFTNTYTNPAAAKFTPKVQKDLQKPNGKPDVTETFEFELKPVDDDAPMPNSGKNVTECIGTGTATFDEILYHEEGTYDYKITEVVPETKPYNYKYDETIYNMHVVVSEAGEGGKLEAEVTYTKEGSTEAVTPDELTFTNTYTRPEGIEFTPEVTKTIEGTPDKTSTFEFEISAVTEKAPLPEETTVTCEGAQTVQFGAIPFDKTGTYVYEVKETAGEVPNYKYDPTVYTMTVNVTEGDGTYIVTDSYTTNGGTEAVDDDVEADQMTFQNVYTRAAAVDVMPEIQKVVKGSPDKGETFTFEMKAAKGTDFAGNPVEADKVPMPAETTGSVTGAGKINFGKISYQQEGTYEYDITEVAGTNKDYSYDKRTIHMVVKITEDQDQYQAAVTYTDDGKDLKEPQFVNTYTKPNTPGTNTPDQPNTGKTKTGDSSHLGLWLALLAMAAGAMYLNMRRIKRIRMSKRARR